MIYDLLKELKNKLAFTRCCYIGANTDIEILMDMETYKDIVSFMCDDNFVGLHFNASTDGIYLFNHKVNIIDSAQRILTLTIECEV